MGIVHLSPVVEASHGLDLNTPLQLFNCLIPQTKHYRRLVVPKEKESVVIDFQAKGEVLVLEHNIRREKLLAKENE